MAKVVKGLTLMIEIGTGMKFSRFQKHFTEESGIVQLMDDLGAANTGKDDMLLLGGGNPAHIPEVQQFFMERFQRIADDPVEFAHIIGDCDSPRGNMDFIRALVDLFNSEYQWNIGVDNIALTSGSQAAFLCYSICSLASLKTKHIKRSFAIVTRIYWVQ